MNPYPWFRNPKSSGLANRTLLGISGLICPAADCVPVLEANSPDGFWAAAHQGNMDHHADARNSRERIWLFFLDRTRDRACPANLSGGAGSDSPSYARAAARSILALCPLIVLQPYWLNEQILAPYLPNYKCPCVNYFLPLRLSLDVSFFPIIDATNSSLEHFGNE